MAATGTQLLQEALRTSKEPEDGTEFMMLLNSRPYQYKVVEDMGDLKYLVDLTPGLAFKYRLKGPAKEVCVIIYLRALLLLFWDLLDDMVLYIGNTSTPDRELWNKVQWSRNFLREVLSALSKTQQKILPHSKLSVPYMEKTNSIYDLIIKVWEARPISGGLKIDPDVAQARKEIHEVLDELRGRISRYFLTDANRSSINAVNIARAASPAESGSWAGRKAQSTPTELPTKPTGSADASFPKPGRKAMDPNPVAPPPRRPSFHKARDDRSSSTTVNTARAASPAESGSWAGRKAQSTTTELPTKPTGSMDRSFPKPDRKARGPNQAAPPRGPSFHTTAPPVNSNSGVSGSQKPGDHDTKPWNPWGWHH